MSEAHILQFRGPRKPVVLGSGSSQLSQALEDLAAGVRRWELWGTLGWHDIRQRYRRSTLGPFWLTISMGMMVGGLGILYGGLFGQPLTVYLPYLALGIIVWGLISSLITEGCFTFIQPGEGIKQQPVPSSVYVFRFVWRNLIVFLHNLAIYVLLIVTTGLVPGIAGVLALVGLMLICLNGISLGALLGLLSLRFRDFPPIVASITQLMFFMTPILWRPDQVSHLSPLIVNLNPFYYFIEVVRGPLLAEIPTLFVWVVAFALTLLGWVVAFSFFVRFRRRIPYWV